MEFLPTEAHPLTPFLPSNARMLLLGSFPPPRKRWSMDFFYPNYSNDMWRIFGLIFFNDRDYFVDAAQKRFRKETLISFLREKGIAVSDTVAVAKRLNGNASDLTLEVVEPCDLGWMLDQIPHCRILVTTGQKATDTLLSIIGGEAPAIGRYVDFVYQNRPLRLYRMPSSSRAYPKPLPQKAEIYRTIFQDPYYREY